MNARSQPLEKTDREAPATRGARLSPEGAVIHPTAQVVNSRFEAWTEVGEGARILNTTFEAYAYCDRFADIANTTVGRFANIAAMTRIGPTDHPYTHAAQHHFLYRSSYYWDDAEDDPAFFAARAARRTTLGPDCWIGHGAIIKPEVTLGAGAVVAAGAVVTRDVAPFMIVAGCPARPLRARFAPGVIDRLLALAWWDWPHDRLRAALEDFRRLKAEAFLEKHHA
ncbi:chloramphenicol acetyltransferase [Rhodobacter calidifons]|uniref:Chloramphenicol acetyltransferase n=1 Tax=Rhodobacter calidifons TaxID=2715277 RepID=A0ABX0G2B1_9RHOB|nr:chloramphenicol acetyltransferase [Rhodobacter calidifons]NHB75259.1 chloramphenicol acetyltransferase [Rhodobacter calidifons]